ncbi:MAG: hypothetical protein CMJ84_16290 [Planctomycetes bacterium]|jgi:hypothetical protein|nr:hypothetical protein [Planctomycetota bacterium]MDP6410310.1 hypothetical protein [Planctomycetota bacterium]
MRRRTQLLTSFALLVADAPALLAEPAHDHDPGWLDGTRLDQGVYVGIHHPRVIRELHSFSYGLVVTNVDGALDTHVREVRYHARADGGPEVRRPDHRLETRREAYAEYKTARKNLEGAAAAGDPARTEESLRRRAEAMTEVAEDSYSDSFDVEEAWVDMDAVSYRITVEIDLVRNGVTRTLRKPIVIPIQPPLPDGVGPMRRVSWDALTGVSRPLPHVPGDAQLGGGLFWRAGDQHLHTVYSVDAFFLEQNFIHPGLYGLVANIYGLDWIVTTDHSNIDFTLWGTSWYTAEQHDAAAEGAAEYRDYTGFQCYSGQEMGLGQQGWFNEPSHLLALPKDLDSFPYISNPSSGLVFGHLNCESEQVIIDRVNDAGGLGFVAHPFVGDTGFYSPWDFDNGATGWAGFEIWCSAEGELNDTDEEAVAKWFELLRGIPEPQGGALPPRAGFPTAFPVGIGDSDAHTIMDIGNTFTYSRLETLSRPGIMSGLLSGRCVASNGPLAFGTLNGAGPGDVATGIAVGANTIEVTLQSTSEFGPVGDYEITILVDGVARLLVPPSGMPGNSVVFVIENLVLGPEDGFVNVFATSSVGSPRAMANPIWLQFE